MASRGPWRRARESRLWGFGLGLGLGSLVGGVLLVGGLALAGNTRHVRTPVLWPEAPCIQHADRSLGPSFSFQYTIPFPDTLLSADELEDSRRHQFIAFCRQFPAGHPPPPYVSVDDLERAITIGEDPAKLEDPEATLETSAAWAGCWRRITPDDARRPITQEAAAQPVVWDLSEVPPGTWVVAGYTWEPEFNLWSRAPWVVRVYDGPLDPRQGPLDPSLQPAAALGDTPEILGPGEALELSACIEAAPGSEITLEWRQTDFDDDPDWTAFAAAQVQGDGAVDWPSFTAPAPAQGQAVLLRAVVDPPGEDPALDYIAHASSAVISIHPGGGDDGEGGSTSTDDDSDDSSPTPDTGGSDTGADAESPGAGSCACHATERSSLLWGRGCAPLLLLLALLRLRTRPDPPHATSI